MDFRTTEPSADIGRKLGGYMHTLLEFEGDDLRSLAIHAATEIDFYSTGIDTGLEATSRLAKIISDDSSRKKDVKSRVRDFDFNIGIAVTAYQAFRDSGYAVPEELKETRQLLKKMDAFAVQLENLRNIPASRLPLLRRTCSKFSNYTRFN